MKLTKNDLIFIANFLAHNYKKGTSYQALIKMLDGVEIKLKDINFEGIEITEKQREAFNYYLNESEVLKNG